MRTAVVWGLLLLGGVVLARPGAAQTPQEDLTGFRSVNPLEQMRQRMSLTATGPGTPLEGAVDDTAYVVGPGDQFQITIGGPQPVALDVPVTADGLLVLPEAGSLPAAGRTLADVRTEATERLRQRYRNVDLSVALARPREFYVHVTGAVPVPGRYPAAPVARVASVLEIAFADTSQLPVANPRFRPSLRNVVLQRRDGRQRSLDLRRYFATGDTGHNPYLQDGDVISVPAYDPTLASVFVDGAVAFPGSYDYREGDTVLDLLYLAAGDPGIHRLERVRFTRHTPGGNTPGELLDVPALLADPASAPAVGPLDHLYVLPPRREAGVATIDGYVEFPGTYPIEPGRTTLRALLTEQAGGLRPEALARGAYLERRVLPAPRLEVTDRTTARLPGAYGSILAVRADSIAILRQMRLSDLDFLSRTYFAQELRVQNRVPVDLDAVLRGETEPIYLQHGDRLFVPRDEQTVFVFGHVNRPGYIPYRPDRRGEDYVRAAGGRGPLATNAYVIKAGTNQFLPLAGTPLESGDVIFVDRQNLADAADMQRILFEEERIRLERDRLRADARIRTTQTILQTLSTAAAIVTTYLVIRTR